jgi:hypothetical protein
VTAAGALAATVLGLAGCTSGAVVATAPSASGSGGAPLSVTTSGNPTPTGPTADRTDSPTSSPDAVDPTDRSDPAVPVVPPGPSMTQIEPAAVCTIRRPLTDRRGAVPLDAVFPGASSSSVSDPREVVPGPDAADPRRCPGELPLRPACQNIVPWADLTDEEFVQASHARRLVDGYLLTMPQLAGNQSPPESSPGTKVVTYRLLDVAPGDPGELVAYLDTGFRICAEARESTVAGVDALVGTVHSDYGAGSSQVVLLTRGSRVAWAQLDGSGWAPGERERALRVIVTHLF